jgi:hypothetical protein
MVEGLKEFINFFNIKWRDGKLVLYKAVSKEWGSLWVRMMMRNQGFCSYTTRGGSNVYLIGMEVRVREWDPDRYIKCGLGLHVGTKMCAEHFLSNSLGYYDTGRRLIEVLVDPKDVVCVPLSGNKIRCKRLVVVREIKQRTKK